MGEEVVVVATCVAIDVVAACVVVAVVASFCFVVVAGSVVVAAPSHADVQMASWLQ